MDVLGLIWIIWTFNNDQKKKKGVKLCNSKTILEIVVSPLKMYLLKWLHDPHREIILVV